ncbi:hypothetical protein FRC06_001334 [Ceratobasidium sp. 370]|nr:hypothetical protein FRC06_001334 [Ceratobasidium sp. 370]
MSVASKNLFTLLNDDEADPTPAPVAAAPKASAPTPVKKDQPAKGPSTRGGRYYQRGGGAKPAPRDDATNQEATTGEGVRFAEGRSERGRGRGRGSGEFRGQGGRGRGRGGPRQDRPDRHSQTGKTDTEKRVNSGWGAEEGRTELAAEESGAADASNDAADAGEWGAPANEWSAPPADGWNAPPADEWGAPTEGGEAAKEGEERPERRQREEEEEDNTMTLTEYLAKKKASEAIPSKPEGRAANEGTDSSLWKDAIQLQRDEDEDNYYVGKTKAAPKARTKKEEKVMIEIDARFAPPERSGRGRGGDRGRGDRGDRVDRGRGRGGRGRGSADQPRSSSLHNEPVDVSDQSAFPSLS